MTIIREPIESDFAGHAGLNLAEIFMSPYEPIKAVTDPEENLTRSAEVYGINGLVIFEDELHDQLPKSWIRAKESKDRWSNRKPLGDLFSKHDTERSIGSVTLNLIDNPTKVIRQYNTKHQLLDMSFRSWKQYNFSNLQSFIGYRLLAETSCPGQENQLIGADVFYAPANYRALTEGRSLLRFTTRLLDGLIDKSC